MTTEHDPILDELWGDDAGELPKVDFGEPYGVGTWPKAVLMDVVGIENHDYGFRVGLVFNLKGDEGEMKYTARLNLPRTVEENGDHDRYEKSLSREDRTRNNVAGLLLGADLLLGTVKNVDTAEQYEKFLAIFRHGIGRNMPLRVRVQQKFNKDSGKFENTGFTEIVTIKARKK